MSEKVRVLVVDDAAFMRRSLVKLLSSDPAIEIAAEAENGRVAIDRFEEARPDVVCLDLDMPTMDGLTALKYIMTRRPVPVVIVSSLTGRENVPFETLRLGVIDFFPKPSTQAGDLQEQARHLLYLIRNARHIRPDRIRRVPLTPQPCRLRPCLACRHLVVIGGTIGSVAGFIRLLSLLPAEAEDGFSILCQIPIHPAIVSSFVDSLRNYLGWQVESFTGASNLHSGLATFIPPGTQVTWKGDQLTASSRQEGGSLDQLFAACGERFGNNCSLILLAGDRPEGLDGLGHAFLHGASCLVQDERTALFSNWSPSLPESMESLDLDHALESLARSLSVAPQLSRTA